MHQIRISFLLKVMANYVMSLWRLIIGGNISFITFIFQIQLAILKVDKDTEKLTACQKLARITFGVNFDLLPLPYYNITYMTNLTFHSQQRWLLGKKLAKSDRLITLKPPSKQDYLSSKILSLNPIFHGRKGLTLRITTNHVNTCTIVCMSTCTCSRHKMSKSTSLASSLLLYLLPSSSWKFGKEWNEWFPLPLRQMCFSYRYSYQAICKPRDVYLMVLASVRSWPRLICFVWPFLQCMYMSQVYIYEPSVHIFAWRSLPWRLEHPIGH